MFAYSPQKPVVGEAITFNATASKGKIAEYKWDFGDKNVTTVRSQLYITHTHLLQIALLH
jgi:PKD repeat protein